MPIDRSDAPRLLPDRPNLRHLKDQAKDLLETVAAVRAAVDEAGVGGQTAIFYAVAQFEDDGLPVTRLLIERGADLTVRVKLPGAYERPGEIVECTALG